MQDLLNSLNDPATGVGLYGQFSLDSEGRLAFAQTNGSGAVLSVLQDSTSRGAGGPSVTELFGIGPAERASRTSLFSVRGDIASDVSKLAFGKLDLTAAAAGKPAIAPGDGRGAAALASAGQTVAAFDPAGASGAVALSVSSYAALFGGSIGRAASNASRQRDNSEAVATEATTRRSSIESVNLDQELVSLTTYQQAFNASARMIQAAQSLYDTLLNMVR
jgi:flagellar hook-associated protein 1 FlgK